MDKEKKKIVIIGPIYPYKGGIAHYTSLMYQELQKEYNVEMISFSMQYPKFLYRKEQKDYDNKIFKVQNVKYWINTMNPINLIRVGRKIKRLQPDAVIFQWWHPYFAPAYSILNLTLKNLKKIYICHNVFPHERFFMDKALTKLVLRRGNGYLVHSKQDESDLNSIAKCKNYRLTPHPTYNIFRKNNLSKAEARSLLNIFEDDKILLFFGFIREYKGLKYLIESIPDIVLKLKNIKLYIVGEFGDDKSEYIKLIEEKGIKDYIKIVDTYVPDDEVEKYFAASDIVILPYISATQSGIVQIAYGFLKPVIVTNVGGLPEVVLDGKTGYVVEPKKSNEITKSVIQYFDKELEKEFVGNIEKEAYKYSWERMREKISELIN